MTSGELYLLRHAEAAGDDDDDPGLSARGVSQARLVGARLSGTKAAALLHSPRRRAAQTAAIMAESLPGVPVSVSDLLEDRTPVPSSMRRNEYPQRHLPRLDETPPAERDVDAAALSQAVHELAQEALRRARDGPLFSSLTHS